MDYDSKILSSFDLETLVGLLASAKDQLRELGKYRRDVELQIEQRMRNNRQEVYEADVDERSYKITFDTNWDYGHLHKLKEYMSAQEWDAVLSNPKPPQRQPHASKCEAFARRFGGEAREIVDEAKNLFPKKLKVTISERKQKEIAL